MGKLQKTEDWTLNKRRLYGSLRSGELLQVFQRSIFGTNDISRNCFTLERERGNDITTTRTDHWRNESSAQWWSHRCRTIQKHPKAQKRKAAAEDELLNEFFKCVTDDTKSVVLKVFNKCLKHGIHKKCSNLACYGDSGRCSLTIKISKQVVEYYNRLENLDTGQLSCKACFCRRKA